MEELGHQYYLLALSAAEQGDLSGAARLAARALSLGGEAEKARRLLGICLFELGETESGATILADVPDLADAARETHVRFKAGLATVEELVRRGKWRAALNAAERLPNQNVRLLNIQGCILAGAKRYAAAGKRFALAAEKDKGGRAAPAYLQDAARRTKPFWGIW